MKVARYRSLLALTLALAATGSASAAAPAADPLVHVVVHIMLTLPRAKPGTGTEWYCAAGREHTESPVSEALMTSFERELRRYGTVRDQFGFGTWTVGSAPSAAVAFEEGDHVDIHTRLRSARAFLPPFLHRLRAELHQREALGEIFGGAYGTPQQNRTRIEVTLPSARADYATITRIHRIFGDGGRGGATQIEDERGVHIYTGATAASRPRIESALKRAGLAFSTEPETFVTDDAPPCR